MKRFFATLACALLFCSLAPAQDLLFWTDDADAVPIRIYVDKEYLGDVTAAYDSEPEWLADGTLCATTTPEKHSITAVNKYGQVYYGWPDSVYPSGTKLNSMKVSAGKFKNVNSSDGRWSYMFIGWDPIFLPGYHFHGADSPRTDAFGDVAMIGAAAAIAGVVAVGAADKWEVPDARFPYFGLGANVQILPELDEMRSVAEFRYRFGNFGGLSILADAGVRHSFNYWPDEGFSRDSFTWSIGVGVDYGGFDFSVNYKPDFGGEWEETFLVAKARYDWFFSNVVGLSFSAGFGISGYGYGHLADYFEFPFGIGLVFKIQ